MAQPTNVFVSPSTTVVQVDTLQNPYTPVILNAVQYAGQTATVLNTLSSLDILTNPIVVSTAATAYFPLSNSSTLIQQPQGYITAQTILPNQWVFLNSYPFRDQYLSAAVQTLTTSTFYTAVNSTVFDIASSLKVENLIVSGNFFQSSGLILNTTVSTFGPVLLNSSLTVLGTTYFSSHVSSLGAISFGSTLSVGKDFVSLSSFQLGSTLLVSTSLSALGFLSTPFIQLQAGLIGSSLEVQQSTTTAIDIAGSFIVKGTLSTMSSMLLGGSLLVNDVSVGGGVSTFGNFVVADTIKVGDNTTFGGNVSVQGKGGFGNGVWIGDAFNIDGSLRGDSSLFIRNTLQSLSSLSTNGLDVGAGFIQGNLFVRSTPVVSTQALTIKGSLGFDSLNSVSTSIGHTLSTTTNALLKKELFVDGYFTVGGTISTLSSFSTLQDVYALGSLSTGKSLLVSGGMTLAGSLSLASTLYINTSLQSSSVIEGSLSVVSSLFITDTALLSSIVLPSTVVAFNFITSTFTAGYQGIAQMTLISSLFTSSIATGGLLDAEYTMDMANTFQTLNLSTYLLSSQYLEVGANPQPSTSVQFLSSFGLLTVANSNTMDIAADVYTLSNTYVDKILSSLTLYAYTTQGYFFGDGSNLSNVNYPARVSTLLLSTASIVVEKTFLSSVFASSGTTTDIFLAYSTLQIGDFSILGNARAIPSVSSIFMATQRGVANLVALNNMYCYGDSASFFDKQVIINPSFLPNLSNMYALGVGQTLQINNLESPNFDLMLDSYYGETVVAGTIGTLFTNTLQLSSGILGRGGGAFFLPEGYVPLQASTNTIQPNFSTMVFNSTLIVNYETNKVGVNTVPSFTFDVLGDAYAQDGILITQSTTLYSQVAIEQKLSSFWLGVTSNDGASNILFSADDGESWEYFTPTNPREGGTVLNVAFNGGQLKTTASNTLTSQKLWLATSAPLAQYYLEGNTSWNVITNTAKFPESNTAAAYNGLLWVLTGYNDSNLPPANAPTLHWSENGITWYQAISGGFTWDGASSNYGGHGLAWNGSMWVVVGQGGSTANSILYSGDGKNWSNSVLGGFSAIGKGVVWSGSNWVATGNNGGPLSSFCVSQDGSNWTSIQGYGFNTALVGGHLGGNAIATDGRIVVAVGSYNASSASATIQYSRDGGYTWSNGTGDVFNTDGGGYCVAWNGAYWLAGGANGVRKSYDGISWTQPSVSSTSLFFHGIAYSSNAQPFAQIGASNYVSTFTSTVSVFSVACGIQTTIDSNCLRYSLDGINWSNAESGFFQDEGRAAAYNGSNLWVAAGKGFTSNLIYSSDGKNWSDAILSNVVSLIAKGTSVVFGGEYWVATLDSGGGGGNVLFYSSNGTGWYAATGGLQFAMAGWGVAYGMDKFYAVGDDTGGSGNTILQATNFPPDTWSASGMTNVFNLRGNGIAYGTPGFVAVGEDSGGKTIKYSAGGISWTDGTNVFPTAGYGVDYNGSNRWVAVGNGAGFTPTSNILYSDDNGATWNNIASGDFDVKGYGVRYNQELKLWMAAGETAAGSNLKYSGDGTNWSNATGVFNNLAYGLGTRSNVVSSLTTYVNQLRLYNTPGPAVTTRNTTPNISVFSTSITFMDTLTVDRYKNVGILQYPSELYTSTFYESSLATISSFVSTQTAQVAGYFLSASLVE